MHKSACSTVGCVIASVAVCLRDPVCVCASVRVQSGVRFVRWCMSVRGEGGGGARWMCRSRLLYVLSVCFFVYLCMRPYGDICECLIVCLASWLHQGGEKGGSPPAPDGCGVGHVSVFACFYLFLCAKACLCVCVHFFVL